MNEELGREFDWQRCPQACSWVGQRLETALHVLPFASALRERMLNETGTRFVDWVDHLCLSPGDVKDGIGVDVCDLNSIGYVCPDVKESEQRWRHPDGLFPALRVGDFNKTRMVLKVESVADFLVAHHIDAQILGSPVASIRTATVCSSESAELGVIERHGSSEFSAADISPTDAAAVLHHKECFARRRRDFKDDADGFDHAQSLVRAAVIDLDVDRTCDLFFAAERRYWESRNHAARVQKRRQDRLGLGWANHDHHTYRSSREHFARLVSLLEGLGFTSRERFYGGAEAGWGAQVLEQVNAGIVIFADVDLSPDEVAGDFAHEGLEKRGEVGTVGLWCRLHGEAMLQAGMHHLECQFDFNAARDQLAIAGITTMKPFTDFPYLKQAFTEGEIWPIDTARIDSALAAGMISDSDAQRFRRSGTVGSHLELLQRDDGYKGFNQTGISQIILATDPRHSD